MKQSKIIAVDFDGTLVTNEYPNIGAPIHETIAKLKREQADGAKIILWTCREGVHVGEAINWCIKHDIRLDGVNENLPEIIEAFGGDSRKIFAHEYWDDRAVAMPPKEV